MWSVDFRPLPAVPKSDAERNVGDDQAAQGAGERFPHQNENDSGEYAGDNGEQHGAVGKLPVERTGDDGQKQTGDIDGIALHQDLGDTGYFQSQYQGDQSYQHHKQPVDQ